MDQTNKELKERVDALRELYDKHSYLLDRVGVSDHRYAFPMFGIECGNGWIDIIDELCCQIEQYCMDNNILPMPEVHQIKEKFAGLRYYLSNEDDNMSHLIRLAEKKSFKTCEICGSTKKVTSGPDTPGGYWISTRCGECRSKE
jgi:hypothetical protein